ncbi:MAG: hypothetical protein MK077_03115 [Phycisphaerales bacterium]|nr:hypothetical protein [Phycisphaerales bacterium]
MPATEISSNQVQPWVTLARQLGTWSLLVAGLTLVAAVVLIPAWRDVQQSRYEQVQLKAAAQWTAEQVDAARRMVRTLDEQDPDLQQRLIAWQLNLVPEGVTPIARATYENGVLGWVESTVPKPAMAPEPLGVTTLEAMVTGPWRLWLLAIGVLCVFAGVIGVGSASPRTTNQEQPKRPNSPRLSAHNS